MYMKPIEPLWVCGLGAVRCRPQASPPPHHASVARSSLPHARKLAGDQEWSPTRSASDECERSEASSATFEGCLAGAVLQEGLHDALEVFGVEEGRGDGGGVGVGLGDSAGLEVAEDLLGGAEGLRRADGDLLDEL